MGDFIVAIILGIVEGLTEFLPVSSTGHMILTNKLLGISESDEMIKSFEVIIQLAAILAIALVYRTKIVQLLGLGRKETYKIGEQPKKRINLIHIALAVVPALAVAFLLRDVIKGDGFNAYPVLFSLVVGGIFMIVAEKAKVKVTAKEMDDISYRQALLIGISQCLATWPGFSRSGATISGGMLSGVSYRAAADFSFLIAIPVMCAATGYELLKNYKNFTADNIGFLAIGFVVSFLVAWIVVVAFLKHIQKVKLSYFAYYRFILAALFWLFILR